MNGTTATLVVGAGAIIVGLVQAVIYLGQSRNQAIANKQALFDRRLRIFKEIRFYAWTYLEANGNFFATRRREDLSETFIESEFVFSADAYAAIKSLENALVAHEAARGTPEYDGCGEITVPAAPPPAHLTTKLQGAYDRLAAALFADLDLTSSGKRKRRAEASPVRPSD
jgi:hypothetical protein